MKKGISTNLFIACSFLIPIAAYGVFHWYEKNMQQLPVIYSSENHRIEDFRLQNQHGKTVGLSEEGNNIIVADFFFTHCPSICPIMTKNMQKIREVYNNEERIKLLSFTVDPERDSSEQLKKYIERFSLTDNNWDFLTGDKKELYRLARNSFKIVVTDGDGGPTDFIHSEKLVLIDTERRIRGYYDGTSDKEVNQLIKDIKKLKNEK